VRLPNRLVALGAAVILGGLYMVGCGGGSEDEARELSQATVVRDVGPLKDVVYTQKDIERTPADSALRAFIEYRRLLQVQAWNAAARNFLAPGFVDFVGVKRVVAAYESQAAHYRSVRPSVEWVRRAGDTALVAYAVKDENGDTILHSIEWRLRKDRWAIVYDSFLDEAFATSEQTAAQNQVDPLAKRPGRAAVRAGAAARALQAEYQQRLGQQDEPADGADTGAAPRGQP
jgi:hypothetical protein